MKNDNPYQQAPVSRAPQQAAFAPGVALMIVSAISIACFAIAVAFNIYALSTGVLDDRGIGEVMTGKTQATVRASVGTLLLLVHCFVAYGAYHMMERKSFSISRTASIIAVIPCISPCYFLGIPFGIWAMVSLGKPGVQQSFDS